MITGETGQRAAVMMVGKVDGGGTADAVKRFCLELRGSCGEPSSIERGRGWPLNRILEAAKIRKEPKRALSEQNERCLYLERVGSINIEGQRPPFSAAFPRMGSDYLVIL